MKKLAVTFPISPSHVNVRLVGLSWRRGKSFKHLRILAIYKILVIKSFPSLRFHPRDGKPQVHENGFSKGASEKELACFLFTFYKYTLLNKPVTQIFPPPNF